MALHSSILSVGRFALWTSEVVASLSITCCACPCSGVPGRVGAWLVFFPPVCVCYVLRHTGPLFKKLQAQIKDSWRFCTAVCSISEEASYMDRLHTLELDQDETENHQHHILKLHTSSLFCAWMKWICDKDLVVRAWVWLWNGRAYCWLWQWSVHWNMWLCVGVHNEGFCVQIWEIDSRVLFLNIVYTY